MKKLIYLLFVVAVTAGFTSCKKDENSVSGSGSYKLSGNNYPIIFNQKQTPGPYVSYLALAALPTGSNRTDGFQLIVKAAPTADKTYKVVFVNDPSQLAADEVSIFVTTKTNRTYYSKSENKTATVKVVNGKITATIPEITVLSYDVNPSSPESTTFSATFTEN